MGSHYVCCRKSYIRDKSGRCQCPLTGNYHFYFGDGGWTITGRNWCQCPLTGNHHFYVTISLEKAIACCKVSMPSNGQPSFLLPRVCGQGNAPGMCQCPLTGNHHFYMSLFINLYEHEKCQCPLTGNHHFYSSVTWQPATGTVVCQCPLTGNHHFYRQRPQTDNEAFRVSMPSYGQPSFLRTKVAEVADYYHGVNAL